MDQANPVPEPLETIRRASKRGGVAIETEEAGLRRQGAEQQRRMTASPNRCVEVPPRAANESLNDLAREDWKVFGHVNGDLR